VDCVFRFISNTTFRLKKNEILHRSHTLFDILTCVALFVCILSLSIDRDIFYANNVLHLILPYQTDFILCENNVTHDKISYKSWLPLIISKMNQMVNMFFICTQNVNIQRFYYTNDIILHFLFYYIS
jgi:hypothetical protein